MTYHLHDSISTVLPRLGTQLLKDAQTQAEGLGDDEDGEALHDFRVSVRHLRSFLNSYEAFIKGAKKHRQRFSKIMALTNAGRDNEVHLAWLKARQTTAQNLEKDGILYLLEHLDSNDQVNIEKVKKQFGEVAEKLADAFSKEVEDVEESFAVVTGNVLLRYSKELAKLLVAIEKIEDDIAIHDARIAGKKLRYTLELLDDKNATTFVKKLKKFQDTAGNLHDLHLLEPKVQTFLFAETVLWSQAFRDGSKTLSPDELHRLPELQRSYELAAVQRRLETEKTSLFQRLQKDWLADTQDFFKDLTSFAESLREPGKKPSKTTPLSAKNATG